MRIAVVLPAPLWPKRPRTVPGATCRSRLRKAHSSPNRLPSPVAVMPRVVVTGSSMIGSNIFVSCTECSYIVRLTNSSTLYDVASDYRRKKRATPPGPDVSEAVRQFVIDKATEKINAKLDKQASKIAAKTAMRAESLDRLAEHLETLDVWTRSDRADASPGSIATTSQLRPSTSPTRKVSRLFRCAAWPLSSKPGRCRCITTCEPRTSC